MAKVLIVEDEPTIALILAEVLKGEGHDVTGAMPAAEDFPPDGSYQAFIGKPFNLDDVVASVSGCLERDRRQSGTGTR